MQCVRPVSIRNPELDKLEAGLSWLSGPEGQALHPLTGELVPARINVPCGHCIICEENRRNMWADRLELESRFSACTYFVTLTYNNENCPIDLKKSDLQKFFKRLRSRLKCRFFACGEYGDRFSRPHYHAVIFLSSFVDEPTFRETIQKKWPFGFIQVRLADREAFRYVAKYVVKSVREIPSSAKPPFALMSRRPGISADYSSTFDRYYHEYILLEDGTRRPLPRYLLQKLDPVEQIRIKESRKDFATSKPQMSETEKQLRSINLERTLIRRHVRKYGK